MDQMSLGERTSARRPLRHLSTSKLNHSDSQPLPSTTTTTMRGNTEPQPQVQLKPQQHSALYDSSDDEIPTPVKLSALTEALLNDGQSEPGAACAVSRERPASPSAQPPPPMVCTRRGTLTASILSTSKDPGSLRESAQQRATGRHKRADSVQLPSPRPTLPAASQGRRSSPAPRKRVVRLGNTPASGTPQNGLRRSASASASTRRTRAETGTGSIERESHSQVRAEMDERQPEQEHAQTSINTPVTSVRKLQIFVDSSGRRIRSAGSSAVPSKRFGADDDAGTPCSPATAGRQTDDAGKVGSVLRSGNSGKGEDLELPSAARLKRVAKVSGSLLGGPARRGRRRQTEEDAAAQDPESQQPRGLEAAAIDQPAMDLSASNLDDLAALGSPVRTKHPTLAAIGKQASRALPRLSDLRAQRPESHDEAPHHEPVPPPKMLSVLDKENQDPAPASFRRASTKLPDEIGNPARPLRLDAGSFAPQQVPISPERMAFAVESQKARNRPAPPLPPPQMSVVEMVTASRANKKRHVFMKVNGRVYRKIDCIGRGGSGKVYRVATESGTTLALKRVSLEHMNELAEKGLRGEIELLRRLRGVERVIQLLDCEMSREKQSLSVLMEAGELDFNSLLKNRQSGAEAPIDLAFVRYYWKEMLECVQAVHVRAVVHSDLKPANFVLVRGRLKLIDFGIANAIQTDATINVHRETMAGTPNYMSPESLMDSDQYAFMSTHRGRFYLPASSNSAPKVVKVGKPSDVWSLGCILYQMVYGTPPFGKIAEHPSRIRAIVNWSYPIEFPATTEYGSHVPAALMQTMRRCLNRDQKDRPTCEALLSEEDDFLYPKEYNPAALSTARDARVLPMTEELLGRVIGSVILRCKERMPTDDTFLAAWRGGYWASLEKAVARPTP